MTHTRELMRAHVSALFDHDDEGFLVRVNQSADAPAPRFFLGRTHDGDIRRFRRDVPNDIRSALDAAVRDQAHGHHDPQSPLDPSPFAAILESHAPVESTWTGPAFAFPHDLGASADAERISEANAARLHPWFQDWIPDIASGQPMFATVATDCAVAICCSVRMTESAHEAGVETAAAHRGHGYAGPAVAAWAAAVRQLGRIPLYSTSWQNEASRAVARKLGLIQFGSDLHIR